MGGATPETPEFGVLEKRRAIFCRAWPRESLGFTDLALEATLSFAIPAQDFVDGFVGPRRAAINRTPLHLRTFSLFQPCATLRPKTVRAPKPAASLLGA